jgi:hypothetical protein
MNEVQQQLAALFGVAEPVTAMAYQRAKGVTLLPLYDDLSAIPYSEKEAYLEVERPADEQPWFIVVESRGSRWHATHSHVYNKEADGKRKGAWNYRIMQVHVPGLLPCDEEYP